MLIVELLPTTVFTVNANGPVVNIGNYNKLGAASLFILQTAGDGFVTVNVFSSPDGVNFPLTSAIGGAQTPGGVGTYEVQLSDAIPLGPYLRVAYSKGAGVGGTVRVVLCFPTGGK